MRAGKVVLKGTADAVHGAATLTAKHEPAVVAAGRGLVRLTGKSVELAGRAISAGASVAADGAHRKAVQTNNKIARGILHGAGYAIGGAAVVGGGVTKTGELTTNVAPAAGYIVGGAVTGAPKMVSGVVDSIAISEGDIRALQDRLRLYGKLLQSRAHQRLAEIKEAQISDRKSVLLDSLVVGGMTLTEILRSPGRIPADVALAFKLQYPDLARIETFADAVHHANSEQLVGLVNGVKGKLFELTLLDHLNTGGHLPPGWHAELARSATQPGWDLAVVDNHGHVADLIQAKATESAEYIRHALDQYPNIDITTTSEVYAKLAALGHAQHVTDSGVALHSLNDNVVQAVSDASAHGISFVPTSISLAVIALSVLMDKRLTWEMAGRKFGERGAKAGLAVGAGNAALIATQTWWIALLAGVGSRVLAARGEAKRERYQLLKDAVGTLDSLLAHPTGPSLLTGPSS